MRGDVERTEDLFSYVALADRVPSDHPLRSIRAFVDPILRERVAPLRRDLCQGPADPRSPPEQLLKALLLQVLYTVRSERMLCEQLEYNLLFRWFVGLGLNERAWVPTVFTERPLLSLQSLMRVVGIPPEALIDAWDGRESLPPPARIRLSRLLREFQQELRRAGIRALRREPSALTASVEATAASERTSISTWTT